jgi:GH15 family glucan-1,4-alpha-glucosidase
MSLPIEDYALISDCYTGALVGKDGSIDWMCAPRYDSASIFGALLGSEDHGRWLLAPKEISSSCTRRYDDDTLTLITHWSTPTGQVEVTDVMPIGDKRADILRRVRGIQGTVEMIQDVRFRFDYARALPWVRKLSRDHRTTLIAVAGPNAVVLRTPTVEAEGKAHRGTFTVAAGESVDLSLTWYPSHREAPSAPDFEAALARTKKWWTDWANDTEEYGRYHDMVVRSLLMLRALTHMETGGIMAAATTSLPEQFGGSRNWDYRYVWLRDASLTIMVMLSHGYSDAVDHWKGWLLRSIAGDPADVQIMYGPAGERDLAERDLTSLPGYQGAAPVRIGNDASTQFQADVVGEVMVALHAAREAGIVETKLSWALQRALIGYLEDHWKDADHGIWEIRGDPQHFTHSRVMVWAAFDRAIRAVKEFNLDGPTDKWISIRDEVRADIEANGFDRIRGTYTQYFGSREVDASLLQLAQVGYLDPDDPRMLGTVKAIEEDLLVDGLAMRYRSQAGVDGLPTGENAFLACSFWLAEQYARTNRLDDAIELADRLTGYANDVGMFSEEYDVAGASQAGNTPQALTHLALVRTADAIDRAERGMQ